MNAHDDAALVAACLDGDNSAFEVLVGRYHRPIYNLALRMLKDPDEAADIAQTAFVKAYEKLNTYDSRHQFFSWLYRIAINESINQTKRAKRLDEYESGVTAVFQKTPSDEYRVDELAGQIGEAILLLKVDYRMVIVLKHYHDFSYQEMGDMLGIPEKTLALPLPKLYQQPTVSLEPDRQPCLLLFCSNRCR